MRIFNKNVNYLVVVFFTLVSLFSSLSVCAQVNNNLKQEILEGINEDRARRHKAPLNAASIISVESFHQTGLYSSAIYEYKVKFTKGGITKERPIICKQFKDPREYEFEARRLEYLRDHFKWPDDQRFVNQVPHFVKYKGRVEYVDENAQLQKLILLEKAEGKSLFQTIEDYACQQNGIFWNSRPNFWRKIGTNIADFHLASYEIKGNRCFSYTHGDFHIMNIFLNPRFDDKNPLTLIDYATFAYSPESSQFISKRDISIDILGIFMASYEWFVDEFFEDFKGKVYRNPASYIYRNQDSSKNLPIFEKVYQYLNTCASRIYDAFSKIMEGYFDKFSGEGIDFERLKLLPISQIANKDSFFRANPHLKPQEAPKPAQNPAAKPAPKRPVAKAAPRRPAAKAAPRRPAAKAAPRRPAAKAAPKRPAAKAAPKRPVAKAAPRRPAAKAAPRRPAVKAPPRRSVIKPVPKRPRAKAAPRSKQKAPFVKKGWR
ncbi:MAG: lipopolysaccharide kinase InaA family protein [Alphaproteobacteria bacterium]|nr:lipopolysaccharide kinase InaA family protein [Alphaproteobacteria bacterium]